MLNFNSIACFITKLCSLLSKQVNYAKTIDGHDVQPTSKPPLTQKKIINTIQLAIDDNSHNNPLSIHTCIRWLVFDGKAPSFVTKGDRSSLATKVKRGGAFLDNQCSAKCQRTTSEVRRSGKSNTAHAIRATRGLGNFTRLGM
jgi:hypothetical protein